MNEQEFITAYPVSDTEIRIGAHKVAMLMSVSEKTRREISGLRGFGDGEVSAMYETEADYELTIERVMTHDRLRFSRKILYPVVLISGEKTVTYGSCECVSIETVRKVGEPPVERVTIKAGTREEVINE